MHQSRPGTAAQPCSRSPAHKLVAAPAELSAQTKQAGRQRTRYRLPWLRRSFRYSASASTFTAVQQGR